MASMMFRVVCRTLQRRIHRRKCLIAYNFLVLSDVLFDRTFLSLIKKDETMKGAHNVFLYGSYVQCLKKPK